MAGIGKKGTVLVHERYRAALDALSKAHLMDLAWSLAGRNASSADDPHAVMSILRMESKVVAEHRGDLNLAAHQARIDRKRGRAAKWCSDHSTNTQSRS